MTEPDPEWVEYVRTAEGKWAPKPVPWPRRLWYRVILRIVWAIRQWHIIRWGLPLLAHMWLCPWCVPTLTMAASYPTMERLTYIADCRHRLCDEGKRLVGRLTG